MRKVKSRRGFTLTETLIAVALLGLLAAGTAVASGSLISVRNGMIATADGEALGSTLMEALTHEVRYGQNIAETTKVVEDPTSGGAGAGGGTKTINVIVMDSMTYGTEAYFYIKDGYLWVDSETLKGEDDSYHMVEPESAYTGLKVKDDLKMDVDSDGNVTISLTVTDGKSDIWSGSVTVTPLNGI